MLACLRDAGVEFVVVGGYAVAHHGHVRATKDLDVFIRPSAENAARTMRAMAAFGAPVAALGVSAGDFSTPGKVVQLGVPPLRIDLITALSGVDFETATRAPARPRRCSGAGGDAPSLSTPPQVSMAMGFSLHADTAVHAFDRVGLRKLCGVACPERSRGGARGPVSEERLTRLPDGRYRWQPKLWAGAHA